ncbi:MAG: MarR family EPS-associated transcriptional regulator [Pseudomonadales bacterium]|nr:MarR family EPS-associated transcriptional regulator [Pseudomonadales bacterium]
MNEDTHYRVLRLVEARPEISQRELAEELGVSLGKANYCVKALMDKGWIKVRNFTNSNNKRAYLYLLTPKGLDQKTRLTTRFLKRKIAEYDALREEIQTLTEELNGKSEE